MEYKYPEAMAWEKGEVTPAHSSTEWNQSPEEKWSLWVQLMISAMNTEPKEHKSWHLSLHTLNFTAIVLNFLHPGGACATALHIAAGNFREAWEWLHQNSHTFYSSSTLLSVHRIKADIYKQISN